MQPERRKKIEALFEAVQAQPPHKRAAFLAQACPDDPPLRDEVELLLKQQADSFLESAPVSAIRALSAGAKLGKFEIVELLGRGGMGEVYRARDPRLKRDVALKVLPAAMGRDPDRVTRFEREARAASSLNHPNIVHIYDIGEAEGLQYIAMEYVPGKTLHQAMGRKGQRLSVCLEYAIQISDALAKAHAEGIVHRDLKPSNIMIGEEGRIKVLDFGLAKSVRGPNGEILETVTLKSAEQATQEGVIVGTIAYMSPEQAEGQTVDARSDIFSFGSVLYEMATGRRAFQGDSTIATLSAILRDEPEPASAVGVDVPQDLEKIISRCLRKDPNRRFQHMIDVKLALEDLREESESGKAPAVRVPAKARGRAPKWWLIGAGIALLAVVGAALLRFRPAESSQQELTPVRITSNPPESPVGNFSLSPDGKYLLYDDDSGIHLRSVDTGDNRLIPDTKGMNVPMWSWKADGTRMALIRHGPTHPDFFWVSPLGGAWHPLGNVLPFPYGKYGLVMSILGFQIKAGDGTLFAADRPGGRRLGDGTPNRKYYAAIFGTPGEAYWIEAFDLEKRRWTKLLQPQAREIADLAWLSDQKLIYSQLNELWTLELNPDTGLPAGPPRLRTKSWDASIEALSASADGKWLCMLRASARSSVYTGVLQAKGPWQPTRLTAEEADDRVGAWTPDGKAVIFTSNRNGNYQVFKQEIDKDSAELMATGPGRLEWPGISPDGQWVLYLSRGGAQTAPSTRVMRMPIGGGEGQEILSGRNIAYLSCSRAAGGMCEINETTAAESKVFLLDPMKGRGAQVLTMRLDQGSLELMEAPSVHGTISPDGQRVAWIPPGGRHDRIRITGLNGAAEADITIRGGNFVVSLEWSADGNGFFCGDYLATANAMRLLRVERSGESQALWSTPGQNGIWGIPSPDGRALAAAKPSISANVWMVENP